MAQRAFTAGSFLLRWIVALAAVLATFNPTPWSYYRWVIAGPEQLALKVLAGICLLILIVIYLRATLRSLGLPGVVLACAFLAACIWALIDFGLLAVDSPDALAWVALVAIATVMAVGLSWSHVRRRVSGQLDVDDVEE